MTGYIFDQSWLFSAASPVNSSFFPFKQIVQSVEKQAVSKASWSGQKDIFVAVNHADGDVGFIYIN